MTTLFSPLELRGGRMRNRIMVAPMCQYSAEEQDGVPTSWHLVHLGAMARGGAGLVMAEATSVVPEGRISPQDTGLWSAEQTQAWAPIVEFIRGQGALAAVQLAHAGNKASTFRPWSGRGSVPVDAGGWQTVGPSSTGYPGLASPRALTDDQVGEVVTAFTSAAQRALAAGFDIVEVHAAHGYLLHQFLSPLSNDRTDGYGGDLAGRARLLLEVVSAVRAVWPDDQALLVRMSATDWVEGGHSLDDSVVVAGWLRELGTDLIDVSSGGVSPEQDITPSPGYQVPLSARIRREAAIPTAAVGMITDPTHAESILAGGEADVIALARVLLRDPQWPLRAAFELGAEVEWPAQLRRGRFQ
ncbi:MAG: NADH:flavin oxidoreductase/NADH oxidase [Actinomycetota bacterium]|nr:NADH:flavin oxidoreductase/NADH oxidase [Actinomycetota bacterium]